MTTRGAGETGRVVAETSAETLAAAAEVAEEDAEVAEIAGTTTTTTTMQKMVKKTTGIDVATLAMDVADCCLLQDGRRNMVGTIRTTEMNEETTTMEKIIGGIMMITVRARHAVVRRRQLKYRGIVHE
jgi:hypothetical protein